MISQTLIAVGLSGGVDSSVAALLLKQSGASIMGIYMKNWEEDDTQDYCSASEDIAYALSVCDKLDIPFHTVNFAQEYWDHVFEYFLAEYQAGHTPNPDILCNTEIKFKAFLNHAKSLGASHIATGHYAQLSSAPELHLLRAADPEKDQTYFLHALSHTQLQHARFPIGHLHKPQVRELAKRARLPTHQRKDSTGICFIGERRFKDFLGRYLPAQPGSIVNDQGKILGQHQGLMYYTLGQRKGIGIGGLSHSDESPWYVAHKDLTRNELIVVQGHDHPLLLKPSLITLPAHWISGVAPDIHFRCTAKTRYRQQDQACQVHVLEDQSLQVMFDEPQRAITPGQSLVLYQDARCLGGARIVV